MHVYTLVSVRSYIATFFTNELLELTKLIHRDRLCLLHVYMQEMELYRASNGTYGHNFIDKFDPAPYTL